MQLAKFVASPDGSVRVGVVDGDLLRPLEGDARLVDILHSAVPEATALDRLDARALPVSLASARLLAPIDAQEVWGAGVTYERSKIARQEESESGGDFYDQVYRADRPELFFKATPSRVVGPGGAIRIRRDTSWCVPEPELALVLNPSLDLVGFTVGNDVSARDIEGRNPLYLPQAKVYDASCALGPVVTLSGSMPPADQLMIRLRISRGGRLVLVSETSTARMARRLDELIAWLGRDNCFPDGAILLTGTGIVPPDDFSLSAGDLVEITIDGIGTLTNPAIQGD